MHAVAFEAGAAGFPEGVDFAVAEVDGDGAAESDVCWASWVRLLAGILRFSDSWILA